MNCLLLFLALLSTSGALAQYEYVAQFGETGTEPGQFTGPSHLSVDSKGRIVIADENGQRVQICSFDGDCTVLGGETPPEFSSPSGIGIEQDGRVVVSEFVGNQIKLCGINTGNCGTEWGGTGTNFGEFRNPRGLVVDEDNKIIIADRGNDRIQVCSTTGACTGFGTRGQALGEFWGPSGVALNSAGGILVAEREGSRIQTCTYQGSCTSIGEFGSEAGQFNWPQNVVVDPAGRIIVADTNNGRVQICDDQGSCSIMFVAGNGDGEFFAPMGMAVDGQGNLIISDFTLNRIQIFNDPNFTGPFQINAGINDAWFNPLTAGQGFFIIVFPDIPLIFLAWFTYDTERPDEDVVAILGEAGHRWITAQGGFAGDTAMLDVFLTAGGEFDSVEPAPDPSVKIGTMKIVWTDCKTAILTYDIPDLGLMGEVPLQRIALDNVALCEALAESQEQDS